MIDTGHFLMIWVIGGLILNRTLFMFVIASDGRLSDLLGDLFELCSDRDLGCSWCDNITIKVWILALLCACLGPLPLTSLLCCFLCRFCRFCINRRRQATRRKTQLAVDRLRRLPGQKMWQARGWLIMMRARRQRSSARSKGWRARLRTIEHYDEANIITHAMRDFMGGQTPPEIELLEAGRLKMNFVRTVIAVVEMNEE
ncbi:unnamed protein product, partial [Ectocarpus sp. 12 AP-2014]